MDSDLERRTLAQLLRLRAWLGDERGIAVAIEKPLLDIGLVPAAAGTDEAAREPCLRDFLLGRASSPPPGGSALVIIETMGYADNVYCARKARTHALMQAFLRGRSCAAHRSSSTTSTCRPSCRRRSATAGSGLPVTGSLPARSDRHRRAQG